MELPRRQMSANTPLPDAVADSVLADGASLTAQMRPALVRYFTRRTGNPAEAEDLAQDVLVRSLAHAHWKSAEQARGYIFRAAVNRWRDRRRRLLTRGVTVAWDEAAEGRSGTENSPECVLIVREDLELIATALEEIPERTRTVLMLIKLEHMKVATVAEMLGISVRAVNKHLAKALAHLAQRRQCKDDLR